LPSQFQRKGFFLSILEQANAKSGIQEH